MVTVNDLISRWRPLSNDEITQAETYISDCENALHVFAHDRGKDIDAMIEEYPQRGGVYTAIVCDIVRREMQSLSDDGPARAQYSQSVNGYNVQGTFLSPGGGLFIKNSELKLLGLMSQRARAVEIYDKRYTDNPV
jgi:hypothetical protein